MGRTPTLDSLLTIGEVASRCGLATSALRYYEDRGLIASQRTSGGQRRYEREVLRRIAFITAAQNLGRSLDEIKESLDSFGDGRVPTQADWSAVAESWRPRLDAQIAELVLLRDLLDQCVGCGCLSLERCGLWNADDRARHLGAGPRWLLGDSPR